MQANAAQEYVTRDRIELRLPAYTSVRQQRELGAIVRFCVARIERELGEWERWDVKVDLAAGGFQCTVAVHSSWFMIQSTGRGLDSALAVWDALSRLEQALREACAGRAFRDPAECLEQG